MAPINESDQFKFLISCIRYSVNGKVDFDEVRKECGIVTKGAAAKRYVRLMKAHGILESQTSPVENAQNSTVASRRKMPPGTAGPQKKRKLAQYVENNPNADDDEGFSGVKPEAELFRDDQIKLESCEEGQQALSDKDGEGVEADGSHLAAL